MEVWHESGLIHCLRKKPPPLTLSLPLGTKLYFISLNLSASTFLPFIFSPSQRMYTRENLYRPEPKAKVTLLMLYSSIHYKIAFEFIRARNTFGKRIWSVKLPQLWLAFSCLSLPRYTFPDNFAWLLLQQCWPAVKQKVIACFFSGWIF